MEYVQEVIIGLNELNEQFDYFIETLEREELCEFIIKAANAAGLETEEDITEGGENGNKQMLTYRRIKYEF